MNPTDQTPRRPYGCTCSPTPRIGERSACRKAAWPLDPHPAPEDITAFLSWERIDELRKDPA